MSRLHKKAGGRAGFTLLEVSLACTLMIIILGGAMHVVKSTMRARDHGAVVSNLESSTSRALAQLVWALTETSEGAITPRPAAPLSTSTIVFQDAADYVAGSIVWGPVGRIDLRLDPGEVDDGIDNDGDGLIDEGQVVRVEKAGLADEHEVVIATGVRRWLEGELPNGIDDNGNGLIDEPGLSFDLNGPILTIRVSLEGLSSEGRSVIRTSETSIKLRNPSS